MANNKSVPLPQTIEEVDTLVAYIGDLTRSIDSLKKKLAKDVQLITTDIGKEIAPIQEELDAAIWAVTTYSEVHRQELTKNGKTKTVKLRSGRLRWFFAKKIVDVSNEEQAIEYTLRRRALKRRFIQTKHTLLKNALLKDPALAATIPGVSFHQEERFSIEPNQPQTETIME
jgi:phage host-nuclease inhibitor protein Gam